MFPYMPGLGPLSIPQSLKKLQGGEIWSLTVGNGFSRGRRPPGGTSISARELKSMGSQVVGGPPEALRGQPGG